MDPALVSAGPEALPTGRRWSLEAGRSAGSSALLRDQAQQPGPAVVQDRPHCVPVIAPEFRIYQLLRANYQATRQCARWILESSPRRGGSKAAQADGRQGEGAPADPGVIDERPSRALQPGGARQVGTTADTALRSAPAPARRRADSSRCRTMRSSGRFLRKRSPSRCSGRLPRSGRAEERRCER